jgi:hypothetical protein
LLSNHYNRRSNKANSSRSHHRQHDNGAKDFLTFQRLSRCLHVLMRIYHISPVFFVAVCIKKMEQYIVGEWIGGGSFGAVHKITRKSDNQVTLLIYYQALKFPLILLQTTSKTVTGLESSALWLHE